MLENGDFYACFGGFADQYWTSITDPNFRGTCDCLSLCRVDSETGQMEVCSQVHGLDSPSTLVVSPDQKYIYCGNETHDFQGRGNGGGVSAIKLDLNQETMTLINQSFAAGSSTCYVTMDKTGKYLLVANHGAKFYVSRYTIEDGNVTPHVLREEGCICVFEIREDGGIGRLLDRLVLDGTGIDPMEHASAHPHCVVIDEDDFVVIPNKGGDSIWVCKLHRDPVKLEVLSIYHSDFGSSPRHACFVKGTPYVLVQNEYDGHLCSFRLDKRTGTLERISRIDSWKPGYKGVTFSLLGDKHPWGIDVQIHPNGRFVYTNNTQPLVCQWELNWDTGELALVHQYPTDCGFMTRGIQIDRDGRFLVVTCVADEKAIVYRIDQQTGKLTPVCDVPLPTPTALRFLYPEET